MKKSLCIAAVLLLAFIVTAAQAEVVLYRETFDVGSSPKNAYNIPVAYEGDHTHWGTFYVQGGSPARGTYQGIYNGPNYPDPTANSFPQAVATPGTASTSMPIWETIQSVDSRFIVGSMTGDGINSPAFDYWGGIVDWNAEYKPNFHDVTRMQFDYRSNNIYDTTHALIYTGGHWYISQDTVTFSDNNWHSVEINWTTTKWDQIVDDIDQWKTWADPAAPYVAYDVSTAGFGVVDTFGFLTWGTGGNRWCQDNITLLGVPEPATMSLLGLGVIGLLRRK